MATAFKKYEPVESRFPGNKRGMVDLIEWDEFFRSLMFRVVFEPQTDKNGIFQDYQVWWYKAQNLQKPGDNNSVVSLRYEASDEDKVLGSITPED